MKETDLKPNNSNSEDAPISKEESEEKLVFENKDELLVWLGYWIGYAENTYQNHEVEKAVFQIYEITYRTLVQSPSKEIAIEKLKRFRTWCGIHNPSNESAHTVSLEAIKFITSVIKLLQEMENWV
jgi:hypothetical protein